MIILITLLNTPDMIRQSETKRAIYTQAMEKGKMTMPPTKATAPNAAMTHSFRINFVWGGIGESRR